MIEIWPVMMGIYTGLEILWISIMSTGTGSTLLMCIWEEFLLIVHLLGVKASWNVVQQQLDNHYARYDTIHIDVGSRSSSAP